MNRKIKQTFSNLSCSIAASRVVQADQYDAHNMVRTAIIQRNTSATSTAGRSGEYSCTDTAKRIFFLESFPPLQEKHTFSSLSCSITASRVVLADQYDAHNIVRTAIIQRNTSAMSTAGRNGEYSCTDTTKRKKKI